jgi:hypothetical protein
MPVVQIEKPANQTLATWFSELRAWFDVNHCEPRGFTASGRRVDRLVYLISFDDAAKARRFSRSFNKYAPVVRRATANEYGQFAAMERRKAS